MLWPANLGQNAHLCHVPIIIPYIHGCVVTEARIWPLRLQFVMAENIRQGQ